MSASDIPEEDFKTITVSDLKQDSKNIIVSDPKQESKTTFKCLYWHWGCWAIRRYGGLRSCASDYCEQYLGFYRYLKPHLVREIARRRRKRYGYNRGFHLSRKVALREPVDPQFPYEYRYTDQHELRTNPADPTSFWYRHYGDQCLPFPVFTSDEEATSQCDSG